MKVTSASILPVNQCTKIRGFYREAPQGIHFLQVFIGNLRYVIKVEAKTKFGAENVLLAPEILDSGFTIDRPEAIFTFIFVSHINIPRAVSTSVS
jgi:hypothetical protein